MLTMHVTCMCDEACPHQLPHHQGQVRGYGHHAILQVVIELGSEEEEGRGITNRGGYYNRGEALLTGEGVAKRGEALLRGEDVTKRGGALLREKGHY